MAKNTKVREITLVQEGGAFASFFKKFSGDLDTFDFEGVATLRSLLSNEKARLLHIIKTKKPESIYALAKMAGRDFKAVIGDIKVLTRFGILDMHAEKSGKRQRLRPVLVSDELIIKIKL